MKRSFVLALPILALTAGPALAEVKSREKSLVRLEGILGGALRLFGGKSAREGIVSTAAVKGNRKSTKTDNTGEIVDLSEEKVYEIDYKDKSYKVTTFAEIRERMRKAAEEAAKQAEKAEKETQPEKPTQPAEPEKPKKEFEVDFDVKETGQKKTLAGYEARQVIMTVTLREKGKTLDESGGFVMTADSWLGPDVPALKELIDFDVRYWKQLQSNETDGMSPEQAAMVLKTYPMMSQASERLKAESAKLQGTPLATTTVFEGVKSKEQLAAEQQQAANSQSSGGLGGLLAKKIKKDTEPKARATIFTVQHEYQEISTAVAAGDLDIPAGFKQKN